MALVFESETCGRCGGSGKYSWNSMHGSMCYGCDGKGERLTKRGAAAQAYLNDLRRRPIEELAVGSKFYNDPSPVSSGGWVEVAAIEYPGVTSWRIVDGERIPLPPTVIFVTPTGSRYSFPEGYRVRFAFSAEEKAAQRDEALAYQETLTKAGKPRARLRR